MWPAIALAGFCASRAASCDITWCAPLVDEFDLARTLAVVIANARLGPGVGRLRHSAPIDPALVDTIPAVVDDGDGVGHHLIVPH